DMRLFTENPDVKVVFVPMKTIAILTTVCCLIAGSLPLVGQVRLGIKGGLSTSDVPVSALVITDERDVDKLRLSVDNEKYGLHLGMFVQAQFNHFFIQPEIVFNSETVDYAVEDLQGATPVRILDEMYRNL